MEQTVARQLDEIPSCKPAVAELLLKKVSYNINSLRSQGCPHRTLMELQGRLMDIEHDLRVRELEQAKQAAPAAAPAATKRPQGPLSSDESAASGLRQRTRLEVNQEIHTDLSEDLVEMVQKIRANAQRFNEKLELDRSVVDSAATALQTASSSMTSVGSRLNRYRKSTALGWMFYVYAAAFIAGSLVVGMLLIQLFPKF